MDDGCIFSAVADVFLCTLIQHPRLVARLRTRSLFVGIRSTIQLYVDKFSEMGAGIWEGGT